MRTQPTGEDPEEQGGGRRRRWRFIPTPLPSPSQQGGELAAPRLLLWVWVGGGGDAVVLAAGRLCPSSLGSLLNESVLVFLSRPPWTAWQAWKKR